MQRILVINDFASRGGAEEVYRATIAALQRLPGTAVAGFDGSSLDVEESARTRMWNPVAARALQSRLGSFQPDVVWLHNYHNFLSPSILGVIRKYKKSHGCAVWQTCHDFMPIFFSPEMLYHDGGKFTSVPLSDLGSFRSVVKKSSNKGWAHDGLKKLHWTFVRLFFSTGSLIDRFLCPSPFMLEAFKRAGLRHSTYFPNPVEADPLMARKDRRTGGSGFQLAFAGRLSYEKGLAEFIRLLVSIDPGGRNTLTVYGDGPERMALQAEFGHLMDAGVLSMPGRLPHDALQKKMAEHDALILASLWYENAPMVVPEAAKNGLPILVRRFGSMATFGNDIGNKILFDSTREGLDAALHQLESMYERVPPPSFDLHEYTFESYVKRTETLFRTPARV